VPVRTYNTRDNSIQGKAQSLCHVEALTGVSPSCLPITKL
jgi:hypothetical protein